MIINVSSDKLRDNLGNYINEVSHGGKEIVITRRGKPKAKLIGLIQKKSEDNGEMNK